MGILESSSHSTVSSPPPSLTPVKAQANRPRTASQPRVRKIEKNDLNDNVSHTTLKRINNQLKEIQENPPMYWKVLKGNNWNTWDVWITTNMDTPYHSTPFKLIVTFPNDYPYTKPTFKMQQYHRFFHPNIGCAGSICQQTVKSDEAFVPVRERVEAIITLLTVPNPQSPLNGAAAKLYKSNFRQYYLKAFDIFNGFQKQ